MLARSLFAFPVCVRRFAVLSFACCALIAGSAQATVTALAGSPSMSIGGGSFYGNLDPTFGDPGSAAGLAFTTGNQVMGVESLGRFYFGAGTYAFPAANYGQYPGTSAGNNTIRNLSLIQITSLGAPGGAGYPSASGTVVATTTINPATAAIAAGTTITIPGGGGATGGWQYAPLANVVELLPNTPYVLVSSQVGFADGYNDGSHDGQMYAGWGEVSTPIASAAAYLGGVTHVGTNYMSIGATVTGINIYNYIPVGNQVGPVSLQFELPEPSAIALLAFGAVPMLRRGARRRAVIC